MSRCVPVRRLEVRLFRLIAALYLALCCAGSAAAETATLTTGQARVLAVRAAFAGDVQIAAPLAAALLREDPRDEHALLAMSALYLGAGDARQSYRNGRLAFRNAEDEELRFHAARMTAVAAMADNRTIATQFWLRRAGDLAPSETQRARAERNYAVFQAQNPWRWRIDASVTPSSNVNGGSETPYNIIDGVPLVGILSPDAQALSGWIGQGRLDVSYRFRQTATSRTEATASVYAKRVRLSEDAKAKAPAFDAGGLSAEEITAGLRHSFLLGTGGQIVQLSGRLSHYRQGGDEAYNAATAGVAYQHPLSPRLKFTGLLEAETRDYAAGGSGRVLRASAGLSYRFAGGNLLSGSVFVGDTVLPNTNFDNRAIYGKLTWALGEPVANMRIAASIGASLSDYPDYSLGFIPVPGGRQDEGLFADLDVTFEQIEYAGFSPRLRIRRQQTKSNVSRFTTSEWAVSVGIESNF